jgi:hypothetical protein
MGKLPDNKAPVTPPTPDAMKAGLEKSTGKMGPDTNPYNQETK